MLQRCENDRHRAFPRYGGRGITVAAEWHSFENFLRDMGEQPPALTLERRENDKGYGPDNCLWATRTAQARNRSDTRMLTVGDVTRPIQDWADEAGLSASAVKIRLARGDSPEQAISPVLRNKVTGAQHPRSRLSLAQAGEIRRLREETGANFSVIAKRFGVDPSTVSDIVHFRTYRTG